MTFRGVLATLVVGFCILQAHAALNQRLRAKAQAKAEAFGALNGETKAAAQVFSSWLHSTPKNLTAAKVNSVVSSLQAEVDKLGAKLKSMIHLIKKGALSGDKKEADKLADVLK